MPQSVNFFLPEQQTHPMGPAHSRSRPLAVYRVMLDNSSNVKVIVVLHPASGFPPSVKCKRQNVAAMAPPRIHVYPLAARTDDSAPYAQQQPFQLQTTFTSSYDRFGDEAVVLASVFTVTTTNGAEYVDGYVYLNQPLESLPEHLANPRAHHHTSSKSPSSMTLNITASDLARRCKFDVPMSQLFFLVTLHAALAQPSCRPVIEASTQHLHPNVIGCPMAPKISLMLPVAAAATSS